MKTVKIRSLDKRPHAITIGGQSKTRKEFAKDCDINNILDKYRKLGVMQHAVASPQEFGYAPDMDYGEAAQLVFDAQEQFMSLPAKVRDEYKNDPWAFVADMQGEHAHEKLAELGLLKVDPTPTPRSDEESPETAPTPSETPSE